MALENEAHKATAVSQMSQANAAHLEAQQRAESEPDVPFNLTGEAVRLMSIHQSKGLEFPVVVAADLAAYRDLVAAWLGQA